MALLHCNIHSDALGVGCQMDVILPQPGWAELRSSQPRKPYSVLYLLHGLSDDHTTWQRRTSIERYVSGMNLAVVMPAVNRSFYADMVHGPAYWSFISDELPAMVKAMFPISTRREDTFAAGLSMGGYGAFKLALSHPDRYAAAASLSGALDLAARAAVQRDWDPDLIHGGADKIAGSANDLFHLAKTLAASSKPRPALFQCCGTEDFLYQDNLTFKATAEKLKLPLTYFEGSGGHDWGFWDRHIQDVFRWLPLRPA